MFYSFNKENFPIVKVIFNGSPESDDDFQLFLNEWLSLYYEKKEFIFYFDTINLGTPHLKYSLKMSEFIKKLKKNEIQYLQQSIILINNNLIKFLLEFIFLIQSPVAPVYIFNISNVNLSNNIEENINFIIQNKNTSIINP